MRAFVSFIFILGLCLMAIRGINKSLGEAHNIEPNFSTASKYINEDFKTIGKAVLFYDDSNRATVEFYPNDMSYRFKLIDVDAKKPSRILDGLVYKFYGGYGPYYIDYVCNRFLAAVEGSRTYCKMDNSLPMCKAECKIHSGKMYIEPYRIHMYTRYARPLTEKIDENQVLGYRN